MVDILAVLENDCTYSLFSLILIKKGPFWQFLEPLADLGGKRY